MEKYTLRKQLRNKGCYAEILLDVQFTEDKSCKLDIGYNAEKQWENACKAGILIFHEYFSRKRQGVLKVTIHEIKWMPVDTNNLIVLYCSLKSLSEILKFPIEGLSLDNVNEVFCFPEIRSN